MFTWDLLAGRRAFVGKVCFRSRIVGGARPHRSRARKVAPIHSACPPGKLQFVKHSRLALMKILPHLVKQEELFVANLEQTDNAALASVSKSVDGENNNNNNTRETTALYMPMFQNLENR